jgi:hypothetical protein
MRQNKFFQEVLRQRTIIECAVDVEPTVEYMLQFLKDFSDHVGMMRLREPEASPALDVGWGFWQHWVTSGCHVYTYTKWNGKPLPKVLITIDTYTCKAFDDTKAVSFVQKYFSVPDEDLSFWNA